MSADAQTKKPLISADAEERIRTLYDEGRLCEAQRLILEEIEKSLGRRGEAMLPVRGEMLAESRPYRPVIFVRDDEVTSTAEFVFFDALTDMLSGKGTPAEEPPIQYLREEKILGGELVRVGVRIGPKRQEDTP